MYGLYVFILSILVVSHFQADLFINLTNRKFELGAGYVTTLSLYAATERGLKNAVLEIKTVAAEECKEEVISSYRDQELIANLKDYQVTHMILCSESSVFTCQQFLFFPEKKDPRVAARAWGGDKH